MEPKFTLSNAFTLAWNKTKSQFWILSGLLIGYYFLIFLLNSFSFLFFAKQSTSNGPLISNFIYLLLSGIFSLGYLKIVFQVLDQEEPLFSMFFQNASKIITYIIASFFLAIIVIAGMCLFVLPGLYLAIRLQFFLEFIVDENAGAIESLRKSWEITKDQAFPLALLNIAMLLTLSLGIILLIIGVFVAIPVICLAHAYVFRLLNRAQTSE